MLAYPYTAYPITCQDFPVQETSDDFTWLCSVPHLSFYSQLLVLFLSSQSKSLVPPTSVWITVCQPVPTTATFYY